MMVCALASAGASCQRARASVEASAPSVSRSRAEESAGAAEASLSSPSANAAQARRPRWSEESSGTRARLAAGSLNVWKSASACRRAHGRRSPLRHLRDDLGIARGELEHRSVPDGEVVVAQTRDRVIAAAASARRPSMASAFIEGSLTRKRRRRPGRGRARKVSSHCASKCRMVRALKEWKNTDEGMWKRPASRCSRQAASRGPSSPRRSDPGPAPRPRGIRPTIASS